MIDLNKVAILVAQLPLQDADRSAMLKMIPRMPMRHLRVLAQLLQAEAKAWTRAEA